MSKKFDYDAIVIWAWSWGLTVSIWLAAAGKKVVLIEKGLIGGDCTNYWCVPSKALIDVAKSWKYDNIQDALQEVRARRKSIQDEETPEKTERYGMKVIEWMAVLKDKNTVLVDEKQRITAANIIIATWSHPIVYPIDGLKQEDLLTNETIFEQTEEIKNLVVIWGGYIWCELAESFANLGVKVTLIQRNERLIPREEDEASEVLTKIFHEKWIEVLLGNEVVRVEWKKLIVRDKDLEEEKEVSFDKVLVALWRAPTVEGIDLEKAGVKYDKKWIVVDKYSRTNIKNIYALGDCVKWNPLFTHWANNEWRGIVRNILVPFLKSNFRKVILPMTLYTNIEVSRVWKTRKELLDHYNVDDIVTKVIHFHENDRSKLTHDEIGFIKINFKRITGKVLWATIVGTRAWDMLPILTSAMQNGISGYKLAGLVYPYPTKAELIKRVADKFVVSTITNIKWELKYYLKDNSLQIITALIWIVLIHSFFTYKAMNLLSVEQIALNLYNFIGSNMFIWPFIYIFLYAIRPVVFFPATLMTLMSWALFWFWLWLAFTLVWENMSAAFAYLLWRIFGKKIIGKWGGTWIMNDLKNKANETPFMTILMTRLLFFPFDLVNYAAGFLKINFRWFFLATAVWIIPGASIFILAWAAFHSEKIESFSEITKNVDVSMLYIAAVLFVLSIVLAKVLKKRGL